MTQPQTNLADRIAPLDFDDIVTAVRHTMREGEAGARLAGVDLDGGTLNAAIRRAVHDALSISFSELLVKAWSGIREVNALTGPDGPTDGKPRVVALVEHTLTASHVPTIHVTVGEAVDLRKVSLPVTLALKVSGVALEILDRQIASVSAGMLEPKVTVKVEKQKILERDLPRIELPDMLGGKAPVPAATAG